MPEVADIEFPSILISDASMAQIICDGGYYAHSKYHASIANMIEQFDGKLPKNPAELEKMGMDWVSNVPYRRGQAKIEAVSTARLNMYRSAIDFSKIKFIPWDDKFEDDPNRFFLANDDIKRSFEERLSTLFTETLHRSPDFLNRFLIYLAHQQVAWGYAISVNRDDAVFSEVPEILNIYFERADRPENIKIFIEVFYQRAADLYALYKKEKARSKTFYKLEGLEDALYWALPLEMQKSYTSWDAVVKTYDDASLLSTYQGQPDITWAWIWNEEIDGKLTKTLYQWARGLTQTDTGMLAGETAFAHTILNRGSQIMPNGKNLSYQRQYSDRKLADVWQVYPNTAITNDRVIQNLRGLGVYAYEEDIQYNIYRNALNDAGQLASTIFFQQEFGQQLETFAITQQGPLTLLPPGFPIVREDIASRKLDSQIGLLQYIDIESRQLTQQFDPQVSGQLTDRATNQQVQAVAAEVTRQRQDFSAVPLDYMQNELKHILQRMKKRYEESDPGYDPRQYFYKRVVRELRPVVPGETKKQREEGEREFYDTLLDSIDFVSLDFLTDDVTGLQTLFQLAPTPEGKEYFRRRLAASNHASYSELQSFFPTADNPAKNINDTPLALIENALFWNTNEIAFNALQNPVTHLEAHLFKAVQVLRAVAEGRDPMEVWQWLTNMIPHAQLHLQQLSQDPYQLDKFEEFQDLFDNINQQVRLVAGVAEKQASIVAGQVEAAREEQAAAQGQQGLDPAAMAKMQLLQTQGEEKMRRTQEQSQFRAQLMAQQHQQRMQQGQQIFQQQLEQNALRFAQEQQQARERNAE